MKNYRSFIMVIVLILMIMGLIQFTSPTIGDTLTSILTTITTIIGLFSVFFEMRKSANIALCNFILELQKYFSNDQPTQIAYRELDRLYCKEITDTSKLNRTEVERYVSFLEMLCDLINKGALTIKDANQLFGYPFFLAANNKTVQDMEIKKYPDYYKNIYKAYPVWVKLRTKNKLSIPFSETPLI